MRLGLALQVLKAQEHRAAQFVPRLVLVDQVEVELTGAQLEHKPQIQRAVLVVLAATVIVDQVVVQQVLQAEALADQEQLEQAAVVAAAVVLPLLAQLLELAAMAHMIQQAHTILAMVLAVAEAEVVAIPALLQLLAVLVAMEA